MSNLRAGAPGQLVGI